MYIPTTPVRNPIFPILPKAAYYTVRSFHILRIPVTEHHQFFKVQSNGPGHGPTASARGATGQGPAGRA
jgi:hypothetical protein